MKRFLTSFLAILLLALSPTSGELVIIELSEGFSIKGEILQKKRDSYYVDLGYGIVQIPESAIVQIIDVTGETKVTEMATGTLFLETGISATQSVTELVSEFGEGVVLIETSTGLGSGFFIHEDGYLITNEHVIKGEHEIKVTVFEEGESGGKELQRSLYEDVEIISVSQEWDLALIKIQNSEKTFKALPMGAGGELEQGQRVFAVGNPLGFERSVSEGIVSLKNRVMQGRLLIQTTAEINPGNSGGPLLNLYGEVVGVNNLKIVAFGAEGLGFAIPAEFVKLFIENRDAFAFDPRNPNNGFRYNKPPNSSVHLNEEN
jgi:serine protease Do